MVLTYETTADSLTKLQDKRAKLQGGKEDDLRRLDLDISNVCDMTIARCPRAAE